MPDFPNGSPAPARPGMGRLARLDLKFGLTVGLATLPFVTALLVLRTEPGVFHALAGRWAWLAGVSAIAIVGLALMRRDLHMRVRELHLTARALAESTEPGAPPEPAQVHLSEARLGPDLPGLVAQFNRMAAQIERQRKELAASVARFRQFADMSSDWFWESDSEHRMTAIEGRDTDFRDNILGKARWESPILKPVSMTWQEFRETLDMHAPFRDFVLQRVQPDGEVRLIRLGGDPVFGEDGGFAGYQGTGTDVTRLLQAESLAMRNEARFRGMIDDAPEAIIVADYHSGLVVEANAATARLFGTTRERLVGTSVVDLSARPDRSPDQLRKEILATARRVLAGENLVHEWSICSLDGRVIPVEVRWMRLPGADALLRASIVDVSARRGAEHERERLQREAADNLERLRQIVETMPYACIINGADFAVQVWNPAAERMFGWPASEILGRNSLEILVPEESREAVLKLFDRMAEGDTVNAAGNENLTRDGRRIVCEWSNTRLTDGAGGFIGYLSMAIDVTARLAAERSLRESEARFRQLTSLSSDWYWEQDDQFRFVRTDTHAQRGDKPLGEGVGLRRWERSGSRPIGITWEEHRRDLEAHRPFAHLVLEMTRPNGIRSYVAVRGEPIFEQDGRFSGYRGVGSDISERYRSDLARAGERRVYELLAGDATLGELMDALCVSIESALARPGVASLLTLEGGKLVPISSPSGPERWREALAAGVPVADEAGACGSAAFRNETVVCRDISTDRAWVNYREVALACGFASAWSTPVRGTTGEVVATFAIYCPSAVEPAPEDLELTRNAAALAGVLLQRFRAQAAQRELDLRYRSLIELAQEGVMLHHYGVVEYANPAMARILREPGADALIGTNILERFDAASTDQVRRRQRRIMELGQSVGYIELRMRAGDGEYVDVEAAAGPVEIGGRRLAQSYVRDISGRKWAEREMQRLNGALEAKVSERTAELSAAVRELEAFSYTVAHDLRAPLRAVDGYAQLLRSGAGEALDAENLRDVDQIIASAKRMSELIDGLLEFSRLSRGTASYQRISTRLLVQGAVAEANTTYSHAPEVVIGALPDVFGDPAMLRQVWSNLILNAFKFTSRTADARIVIESVMQAGEVIFSVADNGAGFDADYAGKLFGMFQRLHSRAEFEGTGVGLAIVKRVVERHHGRVWAEGAMGRGATLRFSMPATSMAQAATVDGA